MPTNLDAVPITVMIDKTAARVAAHQVPLTAPDTVSREAEVVSSPEGRTPEFAATSVFAFSKMIDEQQQ